MTLRFFSILFIYILIFNDSSGQSNQISLTNDLESKTDTAPWINATTVIEGDAFSGTHYASSDTIHEFGFGYRSEFPVQFRNKNLNIVFSEYVRTDKTGNEFSMVVTISSGDSVIMWNSKNISERILKSNEWTLISDDIDIPSSFTGKGYILTIYLWNSSKKSVVDMDNFRIEIDKKTMPSFLPPGLIENETNIGWEKLLSLKEFAFFYNKSVGQIKILNSDGDTLIKSIALISEYSIQGKNEKKQVWSNQFEFISYDVSKEVAEIVFTVTNEISKNEIRMFCANNFLEFKIYSVFTKRVSIYRNAIKTNFTLPVKEVYKKSTLTDYANFKSEYWLDKEGFLLSNGRSSLVIYHPENVSSIQLDTKNKSATINLDYSADHPLLHFPLLKKSSGIYKDHSFSIYNLGDSLISSFVFYSVGQNFKAAKFLSNPYGYLASFTFTEHADYTDLRTQKAVYFGAENINRLNESTGGFLKYSIPVTKSIFYSNPDKTDNKEKAGFLAGPSASLKETEGYRDFLKLLDECGMEICLHTPDHFTCDRKLLSEALDVTKREFSPVSWIDHGYDNSTRSNREDLACDGADSLSKWYAADLWKKYGIKYFWNSYFEDSNVFSAYGYNSFFSVPYSGWDDAFPTPLFWKNTTRTSDIIHWRTTGTLDPPDGSLWSYYYNDLRLTDMVNNRNNVIIHFYPARADSSNGFYDLKDDLIVANDGFNQALAKLSSYRNQEKIRLVTIRDLLDYRTSLKDISYTVLSDGKIRLSNLGKQTIKGLSFSTIAKEVNAGKKEISTKVAGDELIFWFDISPNESVEIGLK